MSKYILTVITSLFLITLFPLATHAARIYFDPSEVRMGPGDSMELKVKVDVDEACINTVDAKIEYPSEYVYIREFTTGDSILSIWLNQPSSQDIERMNQDGLIEFTGGIPGGYCGRIPGDPGESNIIGRVVFTVPSLIVADEEMSEVEIRFNDQTKVHLNDGLGTEAKLSKGFSRISLAQSRQIEDFDWEDAISTDTIPPEPFVVELIQNPEIFEGKYHINFSTVDKQSGVDHYEILELKSGEEIGKAAKLKWYEKLLGKEVLAPNWTTGKMPYVLQDQILSSIVKVKAVDKAGNERTVEYIPPASFQKPSKSSFNITLIVVSLIVVVLLVTLVWLATKFIKKLKNKSRDSREQKHQYEEEQNSSEPDSSSDSTD